METASLSNAVEQRRFGRRHPHLAAPFETGEERRAALRIEVGGDLIEQQNGRFATALGDHLGMCQHEPEEQRLLFAG